MCVVLYYVQMKEKKNNIFSGNLRKMLCFLERNPLTLLIVLPCQNNDIVVLSQSESPSYILFGIAETISEPDKYYFTKVLPEKMQIFL